MKWPQANILGMSLKLSFRAYCKTSTQLMFEIAKTQTIPLPESMDPDIAGFIQKCCIYDRFKRPQASKLLKSTLVNKE